MVTAETAHVCASRTFRNATLRCPAYRPVVDRRRSLGSGFHRSVNVGLEGEV
jgi:hypothetical protein